MLDVIALMMKMCVMRDGFMDRQDLTGWDSEELGHS